MNNESQQTEIIENLSKFAVELYNQPAFLLGIAIFVVLVIIWLLISRISEKRAALQDPQMQLVAGLRGKLEKLEKMINELNTERARSKELYRVEFNQIRRDLEQLKNRLGAVKSFSEASEHSATAESEQIKQSLNPSADVSKATREERKTSDPIFELEPSQKGNDTAEHVEQESLVKKKSNDLRLVADNTSQTSDISVVAKSIEEDSTSFASLSSRLTKTRQGFLSRLKDIFIGAPKLDEDTLEELEAVLISADLGATTTNLLIEELKQNLKNGTSCDQSELLEILQRRVAEILDVENDSNTIFAERQADGPKIVMIVGVNGTGKTTTVAKLARHWKEQGKKVLLVAGDTFRAAAVDQLTVWAERLGVSIVSGAENAKPQTVVFDAMQRCKSEYYDMVIIDTAGRLHNKANLMQELEGIKNIIAKQQPTAPHEVLLVVDGTTGQNALVQAREFNQATKLTGIIVTKLDGSAKGGIVVAIKKELAIPVRYIGVGESYNDLRPFDAEEFAQALFAA